MNEKRCCPSCGTKDCHHFNDCTIHDSPSDWVILPREPTIITEHLIKIARENGMKNYVNYPWNVDARKFAELISQQARRLLGISIENKMLESFYELKRDLEGQGYNVNLSSQLGNDLEEFEKRLMNIRKV